MQLASVNHRADGGREGPSGPVQPSGFLLRFSAWVCSARRAVLGYGHGCGPRGVSGGLAGGVWMVRDGGVGAGRGFEPLTFRL